MWAQTCGFANQVSDTGHHGSLVWVKFPLIFIYVSTTGEKGLMGLKTVLTQISHRVGNAASDLSQYYYLIPYINEIYYSLLFFNQISRWILQRTVTYVTVRTVTWTVTSRALTSLEFPHVIFKRNTFTSFIHSLSLILRPVAFFKKMTNEYKELHMFRLFSTTSIWLSTFCRHCNVLVTSLRHALIGERQTTSFDFAGILLCRLEAIPSSFFIHTDSFMRHSTIMHVVNIFFNILNRRMQMNSATIRDYTTWNSLHDDYTWFDQVIKQLFHGILCNSRKLLSLGIGDDILNCCPRPIGLGQQFRSHPLHLGTTVLTVTQIAME